LQLLTSKGVYCRQNATFIKVICLIICRLAQFKTGRS